MTDNRDIADFEDKWRKIDEGGFKQVLDFSKGLQKYTNYKVGKQEFLNIYNLAYQILMSKNQEIKNLCEQRITSTLKFHCQTIYEKLSFDVTLENFINRWEIYENVTLHWVLKVFCYLSRVKCLIQRKDSLEKDLKLIFLNEVYNKVSEQVKQNFVQTITEFREHKSKLLDIPKLKNFISFLEYFEIENDFLNNFVEITEEYYKQKCQQQPKDSYIEYLNFGIEIIQLETVNLALIVPTMTMTKLISDLNEIIFFTNYQQLLDASDGFGYLLRLPEFNLVQKSFAIFSRSEQTLNVLLKYFKDYVKEKYLQIIHQNQLDGENKGKSPKQVVYYTNFMQDYFNFQLILNEFVKGAFNGNSHFTVALNEVLESVQGEQENANLNYLLPYYFDKILNKRNYPQVNFENQTVDESNELNKKIEEEILHTIWILPYLSDKDIFIHIHQNLLAERLISESFVSLSCENQLLSILKEKCGNEYTFKVETMINDYISNQQIQTNYQNYLSFKDIHFPVQSSFLALSGENWPNLNIHKINLTPELLAITNQIFKFYRENFKGRSLQWSLTNSKMEMNVYLPNRQPFTLICDTIQGLILNMFNTVRFTRGLSVGEINSVLGFEDVNDLNMALNKVEVMGLIIQRDNLYYLNEQYMNTGNIVTIEKEQSTEAIVKKEKIEGDRTYAIEGHIIKILKDKKQLEEDKLIEAVINSLSKFRVNPENVHSRIESLITKEFIYRNKTNSNIIEYSSVEAQAKED